jgi:c-di-GMP-binding flagellar brake protein YcgR
VLVHQYLVPTMYPPVAYPNTLETVEQPNPAGRRRFPRYRTDLHRVVRDGHGRSLRGLCFVISEGGLGAVLYEAIPVGTMVRLCFDLPNPPTLMRISAMVRNQLNDKYGFEFLSLSVDQRLSLRQFCHQLALHQ